MLKHLLIISLLLVPLWTRADTAEDYFHRGAQHYVFGEKQKAVIEVTTGLQQFPDDSQLQALAALLKKEDEQKKQDQQNQQNQQNKNDQQQKPDSPKQDQKQDSSQQQQQQQDKNDKGQDQKSQPQPDKSQEKKDPQQPRNSQGQDQKEQKSDEGSEPTEAYAAGEMTPQQAKQLLDAQKGDEMLLPANPERKASSQQRPLKDW